LVADRCEGRPVLSRHGTDVIRYARDLATFLVNDILHRHAHDSAAESMTVMFWLGE